MDPFSQILIFNCPPFRFKCPETEGMARARAQHLSEGRLFPEQNPGLGLFLAGEHNFPICSTGSKVLETCVFRGPVKFKLLNTS